MGSYLNSQLSKKTGFFGLRLWVVIGIGVGAIIVLILFFLSVWLSSRRKSRNAYDKFPSQTQSIPNVSKEIKEVPPAEGVLLTISDKTAEKDAEKVYVHVGFNRKNEHPGSRAIVGVEMGKNYEGSGRRLVLNQTENRKNSKHPDKAPLDYIHERRDSNLQIIRLTPYGEYTGSPRAGSDTLSAISASSSIAEVSHLGWGHWYTLRDLEIATDGFSSSNVLGEGGYGIVYRGQLADGTLVAVKNLLNNRGQAEKEFAQEVEAIGRVRHKNLVRLLGYCIEGNCRMLVYEFVDNGNLEQWLHGPASLSSSPTWEARLKIALGTAKALAYLHEALEPKVVHRDIKASNILLDSQWNAKVSDFGLAKLLGSENTHVKTRVMGTFGYVAPEYANTGYLNERSDVYSFGILLMEIISGRDPVDYSRPAGEVNLVDWIKFMVGQRRSEEVPDPRLDQPPPNRSLKRALLVALRCVDPDATKRPRMGHVVHMIESEDYPSREDRRDERNGKELVKYLDYTKQEMVVDSIVQEASASREVETVS